MKKKEIVKSLVGLVAKQHEHMDTLLKAMAKHIPVKADRDTFFDELLWASQDVRAACKRRVDEIRKEQVKADKVVGAVVTEEPVEVCRHLTAVAEITSLVLRKDFKGARLRLKEFLQSGVSQAYLDALITRFETWGSLGVLCIQLMEYPQVQTDETEMMVARALTYADELADQLKELGIEVPSHDNLVAPGAEAEAAAEGAAELVAKGVSIVGYTAKPAVAKPKPSSVVGKDEYLDKSMWVVDNYRLKPITAVIGPFWLSGSRKKGEFSDHGKVFLRLEEVPPFAVAELTESEINHIRIVEEELKKSGK